MRRWLRLLAAERTAASPQTAGDSFGIDFWVWFATVINLQVGNAVLGSPEAVSLVDQIRILALAYVLFAAVMVVVSWRDYDSGRESRARRRDRVSLFVFGASFLVINAILIVLAATAG